MQDQRVWLYSFFNLGARWGWVIKATLRSLFPEKKAGSCYMYGNLVRILLDADVVNNLKVKTRIRFKTWIVKGEFLFFNIRLMHMPCLYFNLNRIRRVSLKCRILL